MKHILLLGAGRSATALIDKLKEWAPKYDWSVIVGDFDESLALQKAGGSPGLSAMRFDIADMTASDRAIKDADVVVSMLPPHHHLAVARLCLRHKKHFLSASYVSSEMQSLHQEAISSGVLLLNECGLDPGIDHMSAMLMMDRMRSAGGKITSFKSFTGGLIDPACDPSNPWRYKFTWNPRNVVMAGQGTARYLDQGTYRYIPYQRLFERTTEISMPGYGTFDGYANRDSLQYRTIYGLSDIKTMLRGTLRFSGFCQAWNILVNLGCCDDTYPMEAVEKLTHREFLNSFLADEPGVTLEEKICRQFRLAPDGPEMHRLEWIGLFSNDRVGLSKGTPAQVLEHILSKKWTLQPSDRDLIVMWHQIKYLSDGREHEVQAYFTATGEDATHTAMSKTVGLPLAYATRLLLEGKLTRRGVVIPVFPEYYEPILQSLAAEGLRFSEEEIGELGNRV